ncbi:calcium-binding protein, partial [Rhizobiales bacterium L72]|nr:calcium-binding protein [Propylenella binzhouense]
MMRRHLLAAAAALALLGAPAVAAAQDTNAPNGTGAGAAPAIAA